MKIEIYGAEWCGYCKQAAALCESKSMIYEYIDIDKSDNLTILEERMGGKVRSIPQIFFDNKLISDGFNGLKRHLA